MKRFKDLRNELIERTLAKGEKVSKESYVKKLKKHKKSFEDRYGEKDGKSLIYALATKYAKEGKGKKKLKEDRDVNMKMNRLNYERRPVFSGTERISGHNERRDWVQQNLLPEGQDIQTFIKSNIWMSEHANGGIGWIEPNSENTTPDILNTIQKNT